MHKQYTVLIMVLSLFGIVSYSSLFIIGLRAVQSLIVVISYYWQTLVAHHTSRDFLSVNQVVGVTVLMVMSSTKFELPTEKLS